MSTPVTTAERVFNVVRNQILFGELAPGTRLVQRHLATQLGTSNIPVIEAIRRLERDGLLVTHPKWGAQVNKWEANDIEAVFAMRASLEAITCRLFVQRATNTEKSALVEHNQRYDDSARSLDLRAATEADIALHLHIVECARSDNLHSLAEKSVVITATIKNSIRHTKVELESHLKMELESHLMSLVGVHRKLMEGLLSGDEQLAEQAGREHVNEACEKLLALI